MASVPINQLAMQKMVINAAVEEKINQTQRLATVFDGITRHSPEGMNFKARVEQVGWKQAVQERETPEPSTGPATSTLTDKSRELLGTNRSRWRARLRQSAPPV